MMWDSGLIGVDCSTIYLCSFIIALVGRSDSYSDNATWISSHERALETVREACLRVSPASEELWGPISEDIENLISSTADNATVEELCALFTSNVPHLLAVTPISFNPSSSLSGLRVKDLFHSEMEAEAIHMVAKHLKASKEASQTIMCLYAALFIDHVADRAALVYLFDTAGKYTSALLALGGLYVPPKGGLVVRDANKAAKSCDVDVPMLWSQSLVEQLLLGDAPEGPLRDIPETQLRNSLRDMMQAVSLLQSQRTSLCHPTTTPGMKAAAIEKAMLIIARPIQLLAPNHRMAYRPELPVSPKSNPMYLGSSKLPALRELALNGSWPSLDLSSEAEASERTGPLSLAQGIPPLNLAGIEEGRQEQSVNTDSTRGAEISIYSGWSASSRSAMGRSESDSFRVMSGSPRAAQRPTPPVIPKLSLSDLPVHSFGSQRSQRSQMSGVESHRMSTRAPRGGGGRLDPQGDFPSGRFTNLSHRPSALSTGSRGMSLSHRTGTWTEMLPEHARRMNELELEVMALKEQNYLLVDHLIALDSQVQELMNSKSNENKSPGVIPGLGL